MKRFAKLALSLAVATVVALTGIQATAHAHAAKSDGWHESGPQGDPAHDGDRHSCTMCRLAHETSSPPTSAAGISAPLPRLAPLLLEASTLEPTAQHRPHSPRAPPCLASC